VTGGPTSRFELLSDEVARVWLVSNHLLAPDLSQILRRRRPARVNDSDCYIHVLGRNVCFVPFARYGPR
jgi:hypothetical protein